MPCLRRFGLALVLLCSMHVFAFEGVPTPEYHQRRAKLAEILKGSGVLLFGNREPAEEYLSWRQSDDFYYLTGWNEPGAALLIVPAQPAVESKTAGIPSLPATPYREVLFLPERNTRMELYTGVKLDASTPGAAQTAGVDEVRQIKDLTSVLLENRRVGWITDSEDGKAHAAVTLLWAALNRPAAAFDDRWTGSTTALRLVKSPAEIDLLKYAADASVQAHLSMMHATRDGQRERNLSGILDQQFKEGGCERPSYPSIVGSGVHATELHYEADADTLHSGDVMVVDAGCEYSMYATDITRTVPVSGHFTPRQREIYDIVLGAQQAAVDSFNAVSSNAKSRTTNDPASLDYVAWNYINTHGKDLHGEPLGKYFIHGVGHSVGINVHDPQTRTTVWGPGTVFTIEPGIYIPEEKIGVRIEDTFSVTQEGKLVCLTCDLPKTAAAVEAEVQKGLPARRQDRTRSASKR